MPLVNVMVNGRAYTLACDEGEESHLKGLATSVDAKVKELLSSVGHVGDQRLLLMASLLVADEHRDAMTRLEEKDREIDALRRVHAGLGEEATKAEAIAAQTLNDAARRIEDIAARLASA